MDMIKREKRHHGHRLNPG